MCLLLLCVCVCVCVVVVVVCVYVCMYRSSGSPHCGIQGTGHQGCLVSRDS